MKVSKSPEWFDRVKGSLICPRCKRTVDQWPLKRGDVCAPKSWSVCIRTFDNVAADIQKRKPDNGEGKMTKTTILYECGICEQIRIGRGLLRAKRSR
jgi:hypothetical protein